MALGDDLGADDDVGPTLGNQRDLVFQRAGRAEEVRRQHGKAGLGEAGRDLFGQTFDAGADRGHAAFGLAVGADRGDRFGGAALVADEAFQEPVFDHPGIAIITADLMATGAT